MRIAFADMMFSWPPHGGGDVDMFHVMDGARRMGHEVRLFAVRDLDTWERGVLSQPTPFAVELLEFSGSTFNGPTLAERFRRAVSAWEPDAVFAGQGFLMKPHLLRALSRLPLASRHHAHETACLRDMLRFLDGKPCRNFLLETPDTCRRCSLDRWGGDIRRGAATAWLREYLGARAWDTAYPGLVREALKCVDIALVSTGAMACPLGGLPGETRTVPCMVELGPFLRMDRSGTPEGTKILLMPGRAEDPAKGYATLAAAADRLWARRQDFLVKATLPQDTQAGPWLRPLGWVSHQDMPALYADAAVCVVPSVWEEPFGLVAVEAMAAGCPVAASRCGGLADIVVDGETGLLFTPGDDGALADTLERMLDDAALRERLGAAGRARALTEYSVETILERHYRPLWEDLARVRKGDTP